MGILESERTDAEWSFSLKIYCLQEQHVVPWKREITEGVARQMRNWILKKLSLPLTAPEKQMKLFLKYYIEDGKCCPACWEVD